MQFINKILRIDRFLIASFLLGAIPTVFIIHLIPKDFSVYYYVSQAFLEKHQYAYEMIHSYCENPINTGLNSRPPLIPALLSLGVIVFGRNLLGLYSPFFLIRLALLPLMYLVGKRFLKPWQAFLGAVFILFIPKLQTYSLGAFEADVFVAALYLFAFYFYFRSQKLTRPLFTIGLGISLGLATIAKATGLTIAIGFFLGIGLEIFPTLWQKRKQFALLILYFLLLAGPFLISNALNHHELYITTHHDHSLKYIPVNLPSLMYTIPLYLGLQFDAGPKALIVSLILLCILGIGVSVSIKRGWHTLTLPTIITLIFISYTETCLIGYNIPANYEFVTLLGFAMFPTVLLLLIGLDSMAKFLSSKIHASVTLISLVLFAILTYKLINSFFSLPYSLTFTGGEYYVSLPTILKHRQVLGGVNFKEQNGTVMFLGPMVHREIRAKYTDLRFDPFSPLYKNLLIFSIITSWGLIIWHLFHPRNSG